MEFYDCESLDGYQDARVNGMGAHFHYPVDVIDIEQRTVAAIIYKKDVLQEAKFSSSEYLDFIVLGAKAQGLHLEYITLLENKKTKPASYAVPMVQKSKLIKLEPNKLTRNDGWSLNVQSIVVGQSLPNDPTLKSGIISFTIQNNIGDDRIFMPKGSIVGITGTGGKIYPLSSGRLELRYIQTQEMRTMQKQTEIKPGILGLESCIAVDSAETRISKVTYRDEQGNEFEILVDMSPELKINSPTINGTMEPYKIPDKDWSLAITQLTFRHSIENGYSVI